MSFAFASHDVIVMYMVPLNSLGQEGQNEVQHDLFHYVMPLAFVTCDVDGNINCTIEFLRS